MRCQAGLSGDRLIELALESIASGRLPAGNQGRAWGGRGTGRPCALCSRPIECEDSELEVQTEDGGIGPVFHVQCHTAWSEACRRAEPAGPPSAATSHEILR